MTHTKNIPQAIFDAAWDGFAGTDWRDKSSVARFVQANYTPYDGDSSFLAPATERTLDIKRQIETTRADYEKNGFPMDTDRATSIAGIGAGYIDRDKELIVGIQNDELFKLNFMPRGGIRMAETTLIEHGYTPDPLLHEIYTKHATTVNDAIFRVYTDSVRRARHAHTVFTAASEKRDNRDVCVDKTLSPWYNEYIAVRRRSTCRRRAKLCPEQRTLRGERPI